MHSKEATIYNQALESSCVTIGEKLKKIIRKYNFLQGIINENQQGGIKNRKRLGEED